MKQLITAGETAFLHTAQILPIWGDLQLDAWDATNTKEYAGKIVMTRFFYLGSVTYEVLAELMTRFGTGNTSLFLLVLNCWAYMYLISARSLIVLFNAIVPISRSPSSRYKGT